MQVNKRIHDAIIDQAQFKLKLVLLLFFMNNNFFVDYEPKKEVIQKLCDEQLII